MWTPAITDTPIIRTATKSHAKINYRCLTKINGRYYGLSLIRPTVTKQSSLQCSLYKGSWLFLKPIDKFKVYKGSWLFLKPIYTTQLKFKVRPLLQEFKPTFRQCCLLRGTKGIYTIKKFPATKFDKLRSSRALLRTFVPWRRQHCQNVG